MSDVQARVAEVVLSTIRREVDHGDRCTCCPGLAAEVAAVLADASLLVDGTGLTAADKAAWAHLLNERDAARAELAEVKADVQDAIRHQIKAEAALDELREGLRALIPSPERVRNYHASPWVDADELHALLRESVTRIEGDSRG